MEGALGLWEGQAAPRLQESSGVDTRMLHISPLQARTAEVPMQGPRLGDARTHS